MMQEERDDRFWKTFTARVAKEKADYAFFQTGELDRTRTIINVDSDEALVIYRALEEYIARHEEVGKKGSEEG